MMELMEGDLDNKLHNRRRAFMDPMVSGMYIRLRVEQNKCGWVGVNAATACRQAGTRCP